jgi:hypothetical protein
MIQLYSNYITKSCHLNLSSKSCKQVIIVKHKYDSLININSPFNYMKTAMNKRLLISESHGDSNRCTLCRGKPNTHDTYASHASPHMPRVCFLRAVHIRGNLSQVINGVGRTLQLLRKRAPNTNPSMAEWSTGPPPRFSPNIAIEAVMKVKHLSTVGYQAYRAHITGMRSIRSILAHGANPSVLNRHRWRLQPWRCRLATYHSPTIGLHFPPKAPARSPV